MSDLGTWDDPEVWREYLKSYEVGTDEEISKLREMDDVRRHLEKEGYDGVSYLNRWEGPGKDSQDEDQRCYIAFYPEQIRSAVSEAEMLATALLEGWTWPHKKSIGSGIFRDYSGEGGSPVYTCKCPNTGIFHGQFTDLKTAAQNVLSKKSFLNQINKLKKEIKDIDKPDKKIRRKRR